MTPPARRRALALALSAVDGDRARARLPSLRGRTSRARQRHHAPGSRRTIRSTGTTSGFVTSSAAAARSSSRSRPTPRIGCSRRATLEFIERVTGDIERVDTVQRVDSLATATTVEALPDPDGGLDVRPLLDAEEPADTGRSAAPRAEGRPAARRPGLRRRTRHRAGRQLRRAAHRRRSAPASSSTSTTSSIRSCRRA